ncbi:MipA/OmpV family protein [Catenovulum sp. SM1970]|uniref:MipA/OmpV family protein n=1 Tax=Marinifaba aquimaris TaxID=2741323 RepID=UPI001574A1EF|nr:MipA/OmpV family protein [Marinifaba aquimaris]NTS76727.1 MipA/OmpV family protein [Marinifaba aquimaris]
MKALPSKFKYISLAVASIFTQAAAAQDIHFLLQDQFQLNGLDNGNYFEAGAGIGWIETADYFVEQDDDEEGIFALIIGGRYQTHGFFIEAIDGADDGLNLGYQLFNYQDQFTVDLIGANLRGELSEDDDYDDLKDSDNLNERERLELLEDRDTFYAGAGLRATVRFGQSVIQGKIVTDYSGNGEIASLKVGHSWMLSEDLTLYGLAGVEYLSEDTSQYWYGIEADETVAQFGEYSADSAVNYITEIGIKYALTENWHYKAYAIYKKLDDEIVDSPIINDDYQAVVMNNFTYRF